MATRVPCSIVDSRSSNCHEHSTYLEVCYLLLNGNLPSSDELNDFSHIIKEHSMLHEAVRRFYEGFRHDAHPMAIMVGVVGALSAFYHDNVDVHNPEHRRIAAHRLISKMPTIAAWSYKYAHGQPFMYPDNKLSYTAEFPVDDVRCAQQALPAESSLRACTGFDPDPARRSRAECLDLHGTPVRLLGSQSVCRDLGGHCLAVGSSAWGRERKGHAHARGDRQTRTKAWKISSPAPRTKTIPSV